MDLLILFPVLSMMYSGMLHTATSTPTGKTPVASTESSVRHVRTKRCSCATFLDRECVYFCHLDIIWVNTPERIVSYGLGNAPRKRRAIGDPVVTKDPRCMCLREDDNTCTDFCQLRNHLRYKASPDKVILSAEGDDSAERQSKHKLAAKAGRIKRTKKNGNSKKAGSPSALRATKNIHLLLEKWRVRQGHRARAWEGGSTAS